MARRLHLDALAVPPDIALQRRPSEQWLSVREVARSHGIGIRTCWRWIEDGTIRARHVVRRGHRTWIHREALLGLPAPLPQGQRALAYQLGGR